MRSQRSHSDVDRVRDATDLVSLIGEHVALRPKGREHVGLCPFHDDHKPSFAVVTHKGNAFYKCHACGAGGDAFDFVKEYHKLDFREALRYLADRAGIALTPPAPREAADGGAADEAVSRSELRSANALAAEFYRRMLQSESAGKAGREIIEKRGISAEMADAFMLGLAPDQWDALLNVVRKRDLPQSHFLAAGLLKERSTGGAYDAFRNRLIFPICNDLGQPIAFGARKINPDDEPKYLNSAESAVFQKSRTLYGLHLVKRAILEEQVAVVTEGYTDVIACHQHGIGNVVGTLGTALTKEHAAILGRLCHTVVLLFDGDEAGLRAADRGVEVFFAQPVDVRICAIPGGLDPDDLLRQDGGADRLRELIASAQDALAYKVNRFRQTLETAEGLSARQKHLEDFLGELSRLGFTAMQGVRKRFVLSQLADLLSMSVNDIDRAMPRPRPVRTESPGAAGPPEQLEPSMSCEFEPAAALVSSARRSAERDVLALLLFDPSLAAEFIEHELGRERITDLVQADFFIDPPARHIAERVFAWTCAGESFTMQRLLGELTLSEAKSLASTLYFHGERRCAEAPAPLEALAHAAGALLAHLELAEHHRQVAEFRQRCRNGQPGASESEESAVDLRDLLERRRALCKQGTIAHALAQGHRS